MILATVGQCPVVGAAGGRLELAIGRGWIGCNGADIRYVWTEQGKSTIAWDEVGVLLPVWESTPNTACLYFPLWIPLIIGLAVWCVGRSMEFRNKRGRHSVVQY